MQVTEHFPSALGADDFLARVEVALHSYGFTGHNSIACINLCRDEATAPLKTKIETVSNPLPLASQWQVFCRFRFCDDGYA